MSSGLRRLTQNIRFGDRRLSEALKNCGINVFESMAERIALGYEPQSVWREMSGPMKLTQGVDGELDRFFATLGRTDRTSQLEELMRITELVDSELESAKEKAKQGAKLRTTLGVLVGAAGVVVML